MTDNIDDNPLEDDPLNDVRIGQQIHLWAKTRGVAVQYQESSPSTNALAKKEAFSPSLKETPLKLYLTDLQTQGRGRGSNTWQCPQPGQQILMTWSFNLNEVPWPTLSPRLGLALWTAARATWSPLLWSLKAPNDLYLGSKKVAGLLIENVIQTEEEVRVLIGIGMNIFRSPPEVKTATSVLESLPKGQALLAQDLFCFLDRLSLEIGQTLADAGEGLSTTEQANLMWALNQFPGLESESKLKLFTRIDENANLWQGPKRTAWTDL